MERIDWNLPLETDEPTPRRVTLGVATSTPGYLCAIGNEPYAYCLDGVPCGNAVLVAPKIRNVRPLRTSDECLQRMEALVRRLAGAGDVAAMTSDIAREIVKLLPVPAVDPDLIEARKILAADDNSTELWTNEVLAGKFDKSNTTRVILAGIKRGRELAATGKC